MKNKHYELIEKIIQAQQEKGTCTIPAEKLKVLKEKFGLDIEVPEEAEPCEPPTS